MDRVPDVRCIDERFACKTTNATDHGMCRQLLQARLGQDSRRTGGWPSPDHAPRESDVDGMAMGGCLDGALSSAIVTYLSLVFRLRSSLGPRDRMQALLWFRG